MGLFPLSESMGENGTLRAIIFCEDNNTKYLWYWAFLVYGDTKMTGKSLILAEKRP